jgi:5'-nucleotidase/UDP-sugar diphosphatase
MKRALFSLVIFMGINVCAQEEPIGSNLPEHMQWNEVLGISEIDLLRAKEGESMMNNLICNIMLSRTDADFAFINYDDIFTDLRAGEIKYLDLFRMCPFGRTLVLFEMSGDTLKQIVEHKISGMRRGLAIAGGKVEYDTTRENYNRLTYFQVGDYPFYPKKEYRVVTTDYLAAGNAGFKLLTQIDESNIFNTGILLRDIIENYIRLNSPINSMDVIKDGRWIKR